MKMDSSTKDQLFRASLSVMLNIAEGSGRSGRRDKRRFFVISRGSIFECISIIDFLKDEGSITQDLYDQVYSDGEELSKMLYSMIKQLE